MGDDSMKFQFNDQQLRVRTNESELEQLLNGEAITSQTRFAEAFEIRVDLQLVDASVAKVSGHADHWCIDVPEAATRELAARLPTRQGLRFELATTGVEMLELLFDVDVRDSTRRRRSL